MWILWFYGYYRLEILCNCTEVAYRLILLIVLKHNNLTCELHVYARLDKNLLHLLDSIRSIRSIRVWNIQCMKIFPGKSSYPGLSGINTNQCIVSMSRKFNAGRGSLRNRFPPGLSKIIASKRKTTWSQAGQRDVIFWEFRQSLTLCW